jgi:hypothetical protein
MLMQRNESILMVGYSSCGVSSICFIR